MTVGYREEVVDENMTIRHPLEMSPMYLKNKKREDGTRYSELTPTGGLMVLDDDVDGKYHYIVGQEYDDIVEQRKQEELKDVAANAFEAGRRAALESMSSLEDSADTSASV